MFAEAIFPGLVSGIVHDCLHAPLPIEVAVTDRIMNGLACTYRHLGKFDDALILQENVLEIRQRVLPEDDLDVGESGGLNPTVTIYMFKLSTDSAFFQSWL